MRIATWNVNSIRSRHRRVGEWLARQRPEVLLLQETKCTDEALAPFAAACADMGYAVAHHGRDHWNGVAILSRVGLEEVRRGFPGRNRAPFDEPRLITARCGGIEITSLYAPNGRRLGDPHYLFKLVWLERLRSVVGLDGPTVLAGDFNVAPTDLDVYDPVRWRGRTHASPPEREAIRALLDCGLVDVTREHLPDAGTFTWWSYRPGQFEQNRGLRIDLALVSPRVAARVGRVWIDVAERGRPHPEEKPSDHAPLVLDIDD